MTFRGTVHNGKVILDQGATLPEGTRVEVVPSARVRSKAKRATPKEDPVYRLSELAVDTGISDLAEQHDHYVYGTPKTSRGKSARKVLKKSPKRK